MLYLTQRYLLGMCALGFVVMSVLVFLPIFNPDDFPGLFKQTNFLPMMDLFLISGTLLSILSILSLHPFITNGEETVKMSTPIEHPGLHGNLMLLMVVCPLYFFTKDMPETIWQAERIKEASQHLFYVSIASSSVVIIGFYTIRAKGRERIRLRRSGMDI